MSKRVAMLTTAALLASQLNPPTTAKAQNVGGLSDLIGARGSSAEMELQRRGYTFATNVGAAAMWWNSGSKTCASVFVDNGRVQSIQPASASDCGKKGGGGDSAAAAALVGVAAIGLAAALSSHRAKSGDSHRGDAHDSEYGRGYNDGLSSRDYDRNDSEAYHEGFMAGEAERQNRSASSRRYANEAPVAAKSACTSRGDQYLNVPPGSSVPVGVTGAGTSRYEITVASGHYRARCLVTADGRVIEMNPF